MAVKVAGFPAELSRREHNVLKLIPGLRGRNIRAADSGHARSNGSQCASQEGRSRSGAAEAAADRPEKRCADQRGDGVIQVHKDGDQSLGRGVRGIPREKIVWARAVAVLDP